MSASDIVSSWRLKSSPDESRARAADYALAGARGSQRSGGNLALAFLSRIRIASHDEKAHERGRGWRRTGDGWRCALIACCREAPFGWSARCGESHSPAAPLSAPRRR